MIRTIVSTILIVIACMIGIITFFGLNFWEFAFLVIVILLLAILNALNKRGKAENEDTVDDIELMRAMAEHNRKKGPQRSLDQLDDQPSKARKVIRASPKA